MSAFLAAWRMVCSGVRVEDSWSVFLGFEGSRTLSLTNLGTSHMTCRGSRAASGMYSVQGSMIGSRVEITD